MHTVWVRLLMNGRHYMELARLMSLWAHGISHISISWAPGILQLVLQQFSLQSHTHMLQGGTVNTLEDAREESPSRNIQKGKSNCQELPFSSTPALFILPIDQFSMLSSSGSYKQWGLGSSGSMVGSSGDKHFWEQTTQAILHQWLWVLQGSACNTEINTGLSCI